MKSSDGVDQLEAMFAPGPLPPSRTRGSWPKRVALAVSLLVACTLAFLVYSAAGSLRPQDFSTLDATSQPVQFTVPHGAGTDRIAQLLQEAGVVASADAFANKFAAARSAAIQPGIYTLGTRSSAQEALAQLADPANRVVVKLAVPEGLRALEVAERVHTSLGIPVDDFMKAVKDADLPDWVPAGSGAEGLLFPATYDFLGVESADEVVSTMVDRFDAEVRTLDLEAKAKATRRSVYNIVKLASLVQAEVAPRDYAKAARTLLNRLNSTQPLELDTTVNYALGSKDVSLTAEQLKTDSPFNTYLHTGLPPTPIDNPGSVALQAAASPPAGDWLYFITVDLDTGKTKFTGDYNTFLKYKKQLQRNLRGR